MEIEPDPNKIAAELIGDFTKSMITEGWGKGKSEIEKIAIHFGGAFNRYIVRNSKKFSKIKTILDPSSPVQLLSIFEPPVFVLEKKIISSTEFIDELRAGKFLILTGLGGSGKSVFLRYLFLQFARRKLGKIPIYIELRTVAEGSSIAETAMKQLNVTANLHDIGFIHALKTGKFALLLDALDEVDESRREQIEDEIKELSEKYEDNLFLVSSRPGNDFVNWNEFSVSNICNFSESQVKSLVAKIKYDEESKERFIKAVSSLYVSHQPYLSNPLLCIIMLMTFDQGAGVPEKMHLFFDLAFDVLFFKHDATKGGYYRRLFKSELSIAEFKSVFSCFSIFSYLKKGSFFARNDALEFAKSSLDYEGLKRRSDDFLDDVIARMCLLIKEGNNLSYIHRSFQEYFCSYFLSRHNFEGWEKVVDQIVQDKPNDAVIKMLRDMDRSRFEEQYLLSKLKLLESAAKEIDRFGDPIAFCKLFYIGFSLRKSQIDDLQSKFSVSSWIIGSPSNMSKFHDVISLIKGDDEVQSCDKILIEGDWKKFTDSYSRELERNENFYFERIKPTDLVNTPIYKFLCDFFDKSKNVRARIEAEISLRGSLVIASILTRPQK